MSSVPDLHLVFDKPEDQDWWMNQPNARLGGRTPVQAIADGDSERVAEIVRQILYVGVS